MRELLVFVKAPQAGAVKTRLIPALGAEGARDLYRAMMLDCLDAWRGLEGVAIRLQVDPPDRIGELRELAGGDLPADPQAPGDLGDRMRAAFQASFQRGARAAVAIGTDHPTLPVERVTQALERLKDRTSLVFGPAEDGGYYLLGLTWPWNHLFHNIQWSTSRVLSQSLEASRARGLRPVLLEPWFDVDTPRELERLKRDLAAGGTACPRTRALLRPGPRRSRDRIYHPWQGRDRPHP